MKSVAHPLCTTSFDISSPSTPFLNCGYQPANRSSSAQRNSTKLNPSTCQACSNVCLTSTLTFPTAVRKRQPQQPQQWRPSPPPAAARALSASVVSLHLNPLRLDPLSSSSLPTAILLVTTISGSESSSITTLPDHGTQNLSHFLSTPANPIASPHDSPASHLLVRQATGSPVQLRQGRRRELGRRLPLLVQCPPCWSVQLRPRRFRERGVVWSRLQLWLPCLW